MNNSLNASSSGMYVVNNCLIVPVGADVGDNSLILLGKKVLQQVQSTKVKNVLINVSAIRFMDSFGFSILEKMAKSIVLLGAQTVFVGFQPGIASALVDLDLDLNNILTAVTMEDGFEMFEIQSTDQEQEVDEEEDLSDSEIPVDLNQVVRSND